MEVKYVDTHCHLQFPEYDADRDVVIEQMREHGVAGIVVGCDLESSKKAVELAEKHEHLYASVGLHPNHESNERYDISYQRQLMVNPKVVAIGECGLDYYRLADVTEEIKNEQKELFKKHIALAVEFDKPLVIHCRPSKGTRHPFGCPDAGDAYHDLIEILTEAKKTSANLRGDAHFFVGGVAEAEALIALGFTVSFTAVITFAHDYDEVIKTIPLEHILVETDSPYVAPASRRGKRNDPLAVRDVASQIALTRGEDPELVREALLANTERLFALRGSK